MQTGQKTNGSTVDQRDKMKKRYMIKSCLHKGSPGEIRTLCLPDDYPDISGGGAHIMNDLYPTPEAAIAAAQKARDKQLGVLQRQIKHLENINFTIMPEETNGV